MEKSWTTRRSSRGEVASGDAADQYYLVQHASLLSRLENFEKPLKLGGRGGALYGEEKKKEAPESRASSSPLRRMDQKVQRPVF